MCAGPTLPSSSPISQTNAWGPKPGGLSESPLGQSFPPKTKSSPKNWSQALKAPENEKSDQDGQTGGRSKKGGKKMVLLGMPNRKY